MVSMGAPSTWFMPVDDFALAEEPPGLLSRCGDDAVSPLFADILLLIMELRAPPDPAPA